jgi:hypothetical protein
MSPMLLLTTSSEPVTCWYESLRQRACPFGQWFMHHGPSSVASSHTPVQEKESLRRNMSMNQPAPQDKDFCPFPSWTVPFTFLCLALYPLLLHFQGNHCSKATTLGTSQHYTVQAPVWVHVGWCVVNICRLHSCSGHWKRERDADLTLSQASFTYILTWVRARTLVIGNVQSVRYSASSLALGSQLLSWGLIWRKKRLYIIHYHDQGLTSETIFINYNHGWSDMQQGCLDSFFFVL